MTAQSQDQSEPLPGTVFNPRQVRMLKIAVIVMGVALVLGFMLLIAGVVHQAGQIGKTGAPPAQTTSAAPVAGSPVAADGLRLELQPGQSVSQMALGDNRIAVHLTGPQGEEIRVIDLGTGATAARIRVTRE